MKINYFRLFLIAIITSGCNKTINHYNDNLSRLYFTFEKHKLKSSDSLTEYQTFFPYGFKSVIFIFKNGLNEIFTGGTPVTATSLGISDLVTDRDIILPSGNYDVFSISDNTSDKPQLQFSGHYASGLKNGTDYLWAGNNIILPGHSTVNLEFKHIASRVIFYVYASNISTSVSLTCFRFTPPTTINNTLNLSNGIITPSESAEPMTEIPGYNNLREIVVLPCNISTSFEFEATISGDGTTPQSKTFSGTIPVQLSSGISYEVLIEIKEDFKTVLKWSSTPWNEIDNQIIFNLLNH